MWFGVLVSLLLASRADAQVATSTIASECSLPCSAPFEQCVVFDGVELCAQVCAPGRCDEGAGETCVLRGVACESAPCLPVATCELPDQQVPGSSSTITTVSALSACYTVCPLVHAPVCASNGVSYVNECYFERAKCVAERSGATTSTSSGSSTSLMIVAASLCARDVELNLAYNPTSSPAASEDATALALAACDQSSDIQCSDLDEPVCTSAGTVRNVCYWKRVRRCQEVAVASSDTTTKLVELMHHGSCEDGAGSTSASDSTAQCPAACPTAAYTTATAVCASNGMLFPSECEFRCAQCERPFLVGGLIRQASASSCQPAHEHHWI